MILNIICNNITESRQLIEILKNLNIKFETVKVYQSIDDYPKSAKRLELIKKYLTEYWKRSGDIYSSLKQDIDWKNVSYKTFCRDINYLFKINEVDRELKRGGRKGTTTFWRLKNEMERNKEYNNKTA